MSSRKRVANARRPQQRRSANTNRPSAFNANLEFNHKFRFTSSSATTTPVTDLTLLTACGVVASGATVGQTIWQSVRVNQIEIWSPPPSQGAAATCGVTFPPSSTVVGFGMTREVSDTTVSVSTPAHVCTSPPAGSLCGFWQNGALAAPLFSLTAPVGSIIDVWVSLIAKDGTYVDANTATLVGATVGGVYYTSLDSSTAAGSIYAPVGLTRL